MLNRQEPAHLCGQTPRLESAICKDWEALVKARLRRRQQAAVNGEKLEDLVGVTFALNFDDRGDALCPQVNMLSPIQHLHVCLADQPRSLQDDRMQVEAAFRLRGFRARGRSTISGTCLFQGLVPLPLSL